MTAVTLTQLSISMEDGKVSRWIVTDGAQPRGDNNGAFAVPVDGSERGQLRQFMSAPLGAEVCGCEFTPDGTTLFLSVQHPGEEDAEGKPGSFANPPTRWPDFADGMPPRPSIVVIPKDHGAPIGR